MAPPARLREESRKTLPAGDPKFGLTAKTHAATTVTGARSIGRTEMTLLIIIVVLVLLFGGGGYYGYRREYYGRGGHSLAWIILVILILVLLFGHGGHPLF